MEITRIGIIDVAVASMNVYGVVATVYANTVLSLAFSLFSFCF